MTPQDRAEIRRRFLGIYRKEIAFYHANNYEGIGAETGLSSRHVSDLINKFGSSANWPVEVVQAWGLRYAQALQALDRALPHSSQALMAEYHMSGDTFLNIVNECEQDEQRSAVAAFLRGGVV